MHQFVSLMVVGLLTGPFAFARDLVLAIAPRRAVARHVGRTKRIHRELVALHPDADVVTIDPVLSYDPAEAEFDGAIAREHLAWALLLRPDRVRTVVLETPATIDCGELVLRPFGKVSREGGDRLFLRAFGPLVGRLRETGNIVLLSPGVLNGRLSEAQTLAHRLATVLGASSGTVFGAGDALHWPVSNFPGLRARVRRRTLEDDLNRGRYFEFGEGVGLSRYLRLGIDDESIFGGAMAPETAR